MPLIGIQYTRMHACTATDERHQFSLGRKPWVAGQRGGRGGRQATFEAPFCLLKIYRMPTIVRTYLRAIQSFPYARTAYLRYIRL